MKIISVVGARPNFMKVAPIVRAINERRKTRDVKGETREGLQSDKRISHSAKSKGQQTTNYSLLTINHLICHTGQHYDEKMSKVFFDELELPKPDFYLGVGGGSHAEQTAKIMIEFEKVLLAEKPDLVIVVGDVNSTIACSLTAVKLGIKVAHVEAGLRSFDRGMPEEINRILTDAISDYLFVTEPSGLENLKNEGVPGSKVFYVGHVMIDSLAYYLPKVEKRETTLRQAQGDTSTTSGQAQRRMTHKNSDEKQEETHRGVSIEQSGKSEEKKSEKDFSGKAIEMTREEQRAESIENGGKSDEKKDEKDFSGKAIEMTREEQRAESIEHGAKSKEKADNPMPYALSSMPYILVTMHRPSNVDDKDKLIDLLGMLNRLAEKRKVIFPIHPRTRNNISRFGVETKLNENLIITDPIGYLDFIGLVKNAEVILTDSGGIQEESTYLGVQCVTLRRTTERPITVEIGTNHLVGDDFAEAERVVNEILAEKKKTGRIPDLWDGKAAERIVEILVGNT